MSDVGKRWPPEAPGVKRLHAGDFVLCIRKNAGESVLTKRAAIGG